MNEKKFLAEYKKLNRAQKEAVNSIEGPVMVIAGPGTGKTQIIAMRIAQILRKAQVNPSNILCLTFTNSGVYAMRKRLLQIIGQSAYNVHLHTFHSFSNEIINTFPEKFLFASKICQLSELEQIKIIQNIIEEEEFKILKPLKAPFYWQNQILKNISDLKQEGIAPEKFLKILKEKSDLEEKQRQKNFELQRIYALYQKKLLSDGVYDFDDMILFTKDALKKDEELLRFLQEKFHYFLLDEYQDTNSAQNEILKILTSFHPEPNIFTVGDDEQSIFRFQGASIENILFFKKIYPNAKIIILDRSYRSGQKILDASRQVIENNKRQITNLLKLEKKLKSQSQAIKGEIFFGEFSSDKIENYFIATKIKSLIRSGTKPEEIAVLYRQHRDSENLIDLLSRLDIPFKIEIGGNVLDDLEIQKLIKILKVIDGIYRKEIEPLLFEIMHYPFFKIENLELYQLMKKATSEKKDLFDLILSSEAPKNIQNFGKTLTACAGYFKNHTLVDAFEYTLEHSGFLNYILKLSESVQVLNRLQSLFDEMKLLNLKDKSLNLPKFLVFLDDLQKNNLQIKEKPLDVNFSGVHLMTTHKAKGMEFKYVFIIKTIDKNWGGENNRRLIKLPSGFLLSDTSKSEATEESRRLFYVAMTRAKLAIFITYSLRYGEEETEAIDLPSRFLNELPLKKLTKIETDFYEKNAPQRMQLRWAKKIWRPHPKMKEFLKELVADFSLSPTALNAYLECPQSFFYNQLLRVPKVKDFSQCYGTAVHKALELFFKKYIRDFSLPKKTDLLNFYQKALENEILSPADSKHALLRGKENLSQYFDFYQKLWRKIGPPLQAEYNFGFHNVYFEGVPITGKIDKIELLDSTSQRVKIIDYKTSQAKTLNQILGKTASHDTNELYQAYFYQLLSEYDVEFRWTIDKIEFDFLTPKNGQFKKVTVPLDKKEYAKFKEMVKKVYRNIKSLNFEPTTQKKACQKYQKTCEYFDLCQMVK